MRDLGVNFAQIPDSNKVDDGKRYVSVCTQTDLSKGYQNLTCPRLPAAAGDGAARRRFDGWSQDGARGD